MKNEVFKNLLRGVRVGGVGGGGPGEKPGGGRERGKLHESDNQIFGKSVRYSQKARGY
jgi:hypothetical protein